MTRKLPEADYVVLHIHRLESDDGSILKRMEKTVSELSDRIAKLDESLTKATDRIQEDVDKLNAKVADLQAKVDSGNMPPEELAANLAAIDAIQARIDAIDPTKPDVIPEPTPTPEPPAPPDVEEVPNP